MSDLRSRLIRLAATLPKGDKTRREILGTLRREGMEFPTPEAMEKYLKEHPDADKSKHKVTKAPEKTKKMDTASQREWEGIPEKTKKDLTQHLGTGQPEFTALRHGESLRGNTGMDFKKEGKPFEVGDGKSKKTLTLGSVSYYGADGKKWKMPAVYQDTSHGYGIWVPDSAHGATRV
jgi:hypothetical protein